MTNNYESPEVAELGSAREVILGAKVAAGSDSPSEPDRVLVMDDDE